jgi:transcriptional regulator
MYKIMYIPKHFEETRTEVLHAMMRENPLATLVTQESGGLNANHIPMVLDAQAGILRAHIARANSLWKNVKQASSCMAIFQGPVSYISPSYYPSKLETEKVVPTWNYAVVHVHAKLKIMDDAAWILNQVQSLTAQQETPRQQPWQVSDAPKEYIDKLIGALIGLELSIEAIEGKWKVSQNQKPVDHQGVIDGLLKENTQNAATMAMLVKNSRV